MVIRQDKGITNILGKGTFINGKITIEGSIHIDGIVEGNIKVTDTLIVGKNGKIHGDIHAKDCLIGGRIEGNLECESRAEFQSGARLKGDIRCKQLVIEEGVIFDGNCTMSEKELPKKEVKETKEIKEVKKV